MQSHANTTASSRNTHELTLMGLDHPAAREAMDLVQFLSMKHILVSPEGNHYGLVDAQLREQGLARDIGLTLPNMFAVPALLPGYKHAGVLAVTRHILQSLFAQSAINISSRAPITA
ncbi:hypothetical protein ACIP6T_11780 [Pantoea sp. NPDC088449]|uniref:hypothetical protein n=1 Tax=Pantoea sp. NPDC088449 TaxID=3364392 RepID=UPI00380B4350